LWVDQSLGDISKEKLNEYIQKGIAYRTKTGNYRKKQYLDEMPGELISDFWDDMQPINSQSKEKIDIEGQKSEELIKRIISSASEVGDLVLDFQLGSGTTAAVTHKMKRQYIGIEQLDYNENDSIIRLKNVIKGDQSGISKSINWAGGGDFVYIELMKWNQLYIDKIIQAESPDELKQIWDTMKAKAFLSYKVEPKMIDENARDFEELSLGNQKKFLLECLDKNQLYVNLSEIDDMDYNVSEGDKRLNKLFYGLK